MMFTPEKLYELLDYDPSTGIFRWRVNRSNVRAGTVAGAINPRYKYRHISINKKFYRANRLAWFYMTGKWPKFQIDHKNGIRDDNSWDNLREAFPRQNSANQKMRIDNSTGFKGVSRKRSKYRARITVNGTEISLGSYDTPKLAHLAYCEAAKKYHGEYARAA